MPSDATPDVTRYTGALFLPFAAATLVCIGMVGVPNQASDEAVSQAVQARGLWVGLVGAGAAISGCLIIAFVLWLDSRRTMPGVCKVAGILWGSMWVLAGALYGTSLELAGWHEHPAGAHTVTAVGYLLLVSPLSGFLGGLLAVGHGLGAAANERVWSLGLGGLAMATSVLGAAGGIGLMGMAPFLLWWLRQSGRAIWRPDEQNIAIPA